MRYVFRLLVVVVPVHTAIAADSPVDYVRQVKPILKARCYACHSGLKQKAGLRLDTGVLIRRGNERGSAVVPGRVDKSTLIERIVEKDESLRMPPEGKPLTTEQISLIKAWVKQGAHSPKEEKPQTDPRAHWSFHPARRPATPKTRNQTWVVNPIDAFIAAQHERRGLTPNPPADKATLLRRVFLDLVGLPPTAKELCAFLADDSKDAYKKVVERLLASPQHGERWGRHWMDVWRYSDWHGSGNEIRYGQRHLWRWRDWIVQSLNADKGYDRMILEMLAADEVAPTDPKLLPATGFIGRNWYKFDRNVWMRELVEHTATGFLAVTLKCARCHDHKFDPMTQEEYYRFRAFFEPHDVRVDRIPGKTGTTKDTKLGAVLADGIPRAYDKTLDVPTYVFRRGDDRAPMKDHPLQPGVPQSLGGKVTIKSVALPAAAFLPDLRPDLIRQRIQAAATAVEQARQALVRAEKTIVTARENLQRSKSGRPPRQQVWRFRGVYHDDFSDSKKGVWKTRSGKWNYQNGKLVQSQVGTFLTRELQIPPPQDLLVRVRFKPTTAGAIHSVGVGFDVDPGKQMQAIYTWISNGRSGVSAFHRENGKEVYPKSAIIPLPLKLNEEITLDFAARGSLLNVWVNGKLAIVHRMPMSRRPGSFSLWNHSATAEYSELRIAELPKSIRLAETSAEKLASPFVKTTRASPAEILANSIRGKALAARQLAYVAAQQTAAKSRVAAEQAKYASPFDTTHFKTLATTAAHAQRLVELTKAERDLLSARHQLEDIRSTATAKSKPLIASAQALTIAEDAVTMAKSATAKTDGNYTSFAVAFPKTSTGRRSALARWITDASNPRTARVAVNHIWLRHFDRAIVASVADFGLRAEPRSHPQLLDWLAVELTENRWSMKHIHRLIVMSNTYRMSSRLGRQTANEKADPANRFLWRMNSRRMEAEVVRDSVLSLSGRLDLKREGPSIAASKGQSIPRRSLYFQSAPNRQMPFLKLFDAANPNECYARTPSVIPQQSLALMNSALAVDSARRLAGMIAASLKMSGKNDDETFVAAAFAEILCRRPTPLESARCRAFLQEQVKLLSRKGPQPVFPGTSESAVPPSSDPVLRARENLALVLFNHNDFVTIR